MVHMDEELFQSILRVLHSMPRISLSFAIVPPEFDLSVEYLQSLMMVVALALGSGFAVLVGLALLLCLVISFAPPVYWPSWFYRLFVAGLGVALVAVASLSMEGTHDMQQGMSELLSSVDELSGVLGEVANRSTDLTAPVAAYNLTISAAAACLGCFAPGDPDVPPAWANFTRKLCGEENQLDPAETDTGLLSAGPRALSDAAHFAEIADAAPRQAAHTAHVLTASTGWHAYAATLPIYALTCVASCAVIGAIVGRRNWLLLAQFVGVIVWWMMCAVVSVEIAIATGFADACGIPDDSPNTFLRGVVVRVMTGLEEESHEEEPHFFTHLSAHYLTNCSAPDPASAPLDRLVREADLFSSVLSALPSPLDKCRPDNLAGEVQDLHVYAERALEPLGGKDGCGGVGPIGKLFDHASDALCSQLALGFVELFFYQLCAGCTLLLLSMLMPGLWHSHHLPPPEWPTRQSCLRALRRATMRRDGHDYICACDPRSFVRRLYACVRCAPAEADAVSPMLAETDVRAPMLLPGAAASHGEVSHCAAEPTTNDSASLVVEATESAPAEDSPLGGATFSSGRASPEIETEFARPSSRASRPSSQRASQRASPSASPVFAPTEASLTVEPLIAPMERQESTLSSHEAL